MVAIFEGVHDVYNVSGKEKLKTLPKERLNSSTVTKKHWTDKRTDKRQREMLHNIDEREYITF